MTNNEMTVEQRVSNLETKFEMFMREMSEFKQEMRDFKTEMRDRDNQRATEIQELRQRQDAAQTKHEADMREINKKIDDKFDKISSQLQMMSVTTILGVGAIVWAIVSALK